MAVKIKKETDKVEFYIDDKQVLTITISELNKLTAEVKEKLLLYGVGVLLQRETAGVKSPEKQREKILQRWKALQNGKWKSESKKTSPREAMRQTQISMLKALPREQAIQLVESLKQNNALYLDTNDLRALGLA